MTWKLQAITDEMIGSEISVDRDMLVGRHQEADIVLQSADISRRHAAFILKGAELAVQDLKSSNGTYVNDIRIDAETLLKNDDIVQFASLKFSVLAPVKVVLAETTVDQVIEVESVAEPTAIETPVSEPIVVGVAPKIDQPSEAVATSEYVAEKVAVSVQKISKPLTVDQSISDEHVLQNVPQTPAQEMTEQGMPSLAERAVETPISSDGMPERIVVPKPAPIPNPTQLEAQSAPSAATEVKSTVPVQQEEKKNASIGLISIIVLVILAILAWLFFQ